MTNEELDALPEIGGIGQKEVIIDGRHVNIPILHGMAIYQGSDEWYVTDTQGQHWMVGYIEGHRVKRKMNQ